MTLAALSLGALVLAVLVSCVSEVNIGVLAIALAWLVGTYAGGLTPAALVAGFPSQVFLTLVGVTLFFGHAQANGTLPQIAAYAVRLCRGRRGTIPIMFFVLTLALSSAGPGNIAATALMAPLAMSVAGASGISAFLMSLMVANGASAGSLSPFAPAGIVVNGIMDGWGIPDVAALNYLNNVVVHTLVTFTGYFAFGGWRLFRIKPAETAITAAGDEPARRNPGPFEWRHAVTLVLIGALIGSVVFAEVNVGLAAFGGAVLLTLLRPSNERQAMSLIPWKVILMVSGVSVLVAMLEKTGGLDLSATLLARIATPATATAVAAFFSGAISIFSSTSGVVLPALIPMVPGFVERLGGGSLLAVASAINVNGHLVDVSPLSTLGALCLASAPATTDARRLFNQLMAWGASMAVVGALVCWLVFGVLGLA